MNFPRTSAELNIAAAKVTAPLSTYESIKAKIDRGINRQAEGRKEVADGIKEMITTKAYLKHYKTVAAFAEAEYGKSRRWIYDMISECIPENELNQSPCAPSAQIQIQPQPLTPKTVKDDLPAPEPLWEQDEPEKPWAKAVADLPKRVDMHAWSLKLRTLLEDMPKSEIHNKLTKENIKAFEGGVTALRGLLPELLELCKCGCGLSAAMSEMLFRHGVPCMGLTVKYAGMIRRQLEKNQWRLPLWLEFAKNKGEWEERKFAGKQKNKGN